MNYRILIESAHEIKYVQVRDVEGVKRALMLLREKYSFEDWRVVNMALTSEA